MRRSVLVAVIAWLGVVIAGSTMTWATINTAGQEFLSPGGVPTPRADATSGPSRPDRTDPPGPRDRSPSASPGDGDRRRPTQEPPAPDPTRTDGADRAPLPEAPEPGPRPFTWRGAAGSVTVVCDGARVSLRAASPANGYSVEVRERGPDEVEVRLESDDAETDVEVRCVGAEARFDVRS